MRSLTFSFGRRHMPDQAETSPVVWAWISGGGGDEGRRSCHFHPAVFNNAAQLAGPPRQNLRK